MGTVASGLVCLQLVSQSSCVHSHGLVVGLSPPRPLRTPLCRGDPRGVGEPSATARARLRTVFPGGAPCGGPKAWARPGHHATDPRLGQKLGEGGALGRTGGVVWRLLRGRCAVRPRLGRPRAYNRAPGRRRVWLPESQQPFPFGARDGTPPSGSSLGWTGGGGREKGRLTLGAGAGPPRSVLEASTWRSVPRVPLAPPCAVRSSDQRSSGCAAVLVMLLRHGNHVCGLCLSLRSSGRRLRLPHWPTGAEWMEEASGDVSASPGLEPRPTGHFRAWPECSGSCPTWARARLGGDEADIPRGHAGQRAGGPLAGAPGCQRPR